MGNSCLCKICKNCLDNNPNKTITITENNSTKILEKGFYDMILDFSNFEQLKKDGWKITFGPDCEKKYETCKSNNNVVIGIIGNKNRGKSFLLGKIIGNINYSAESGFLVTTKGISANFPTIDEKKNNLNVITLDTAGKDNPLLDSGNFNINQITKKEKERQDKIKNIARDQKVSEIVLSDFIIHESDVLITVMEQLSFAEQEMLKNLLNQLRAKKLSTKVIPKKLIVIHNLLNLSSVESIKKFVSITLLKSLTFKLKKQKMTPFIENNLNNIDDRNKFFYIQEIEDLDNLEIFHLIIGNDNNEEIREEFNEPAIRFIRRAIKIASSKKFDLINNFKNFIIEHSQKYLNGNGLREDSLIVKNNQGEIPETIVLKDKKEQIDLKGVFVDSKGIHNFFATIEPNYSTNICQEKNSEKYYLEVIFEMFGKIKNEMKVIHGIHRDKHVITIEGEIEDTNNIKNAQGTLKYKRFFFQIVVNKFYELEEKENDINKIKYHLAKIDETNKVIKEDKEFGIYQIIFPIKFIKMN